MDSTQNNGILQEQEHKQEHKQEQENVSLTEIRNKFDNIVQEEYLNIKRKYFNAINNEQLFFKKTIITDDSDVHLTCYIKYTAVLEKL